MTLHTFVLKASADHPTSNQKRGTAQDAEIVQDLIPKIIHSYLESVESALGKGYVGEMLTVQHLDVLAVLAFREVPQTPARSRLELQHRTHQRKRCQLPNL